MNKPMRSSFEAEYSAITRWVKESGNVEISYDPTQTPLIRR